MEFEGKWEFIEKVSAFNQIRINAVHYITKKNYSEISQELSDIKTKFGGIFELYDNIQYWFRVVFHDFKKDIFIDYIEEDEE